jgi:hypothetical protein
MEPADNPCSTDVVAVFVLFARDMPVNETLCDPSEDGPVTVVAIVLAGVNPPYRSRATI